MYNCLGSTVLGSSAGSLIGIRTGLNTGSEERISIGLSPGGIHVEYPGNSDGVRDR